MDARAAFSAGVLHGSGQGGPPIDLARAPELLRAEYRRGVQFGADLAAAGLCSAPSLPPLMPLVLPGLPGERGGRGAPGAPAPGSIYLQGARSPLQAQIDAALAAAGGKVSPTDPRLVPAPGAAGRILYDDGTAWRVLNIGDEDEVLTVSSGLPSWAAGGGGNVSYPQVVSFTSPQSVASATLGLAAVLAPAGSTWQVRGENDASPSGQTLSCRIYWHTEIDAIGAFTEDAASKIEWPDGTAANTKKVSAAVFTVGASPLYVRLVYGFSSGTYNSNCQFQLERVS